MAGNNEECPVDVHSQYRIHSPDRLTQLPGISLILIESLFQKSQQMILDAKILTLFDPNKTILLFCYASMFGVGMVAT